MARLRLMRPGAALLVLLQFALLLAAPAEAQDSVLLPRHVAADLASDLIARDEARDALYARDEAMLADVDRSRSMEPRDQDRQLRLMSLGASISEGVLSTDKNGFRKWFRDQLRWKGWQVDYVGSRKWGLMKDNENEAHPEGIITEIPGMNLVGVRQAWEASKWMKPNLVIINVGTSECSKNLDTDDAGERMRGLVEAVLADSPGVSIILSTLAPSPAIAQCAAKLSEQIRLLMPDFSKEKVVLADFERAMDITLMGFDGIHPDNRGYKFMASVLWDAFEKLQDGIVTPLDDGVDRSETTTKCLKVAGDARGPVSLSMVSGLDNGEYVHQSEDRGVLAQGRIQKAADSETSSIPSRVWFAEILATNNTDRSEALDDWIHLSRDAADGKPKYLFRENLGNGSFAESVEMDVQLDCGDGSELAWADFNNDGLADFWCIAKDTAISVSINQGTNPPTFQDLGVVVRASGSSDPADVRVADIDGDGRADICFIYEGSKIGCSRNGGHDIEFYWQGFEAPDAFRGTVFSSDSQGDAANFVLADINGDFRDDVIRIANEGDADLWLNQRGAGTGLVPHWSVSTLNGTQTSRVRDQVKFGRIYGSGRRDYIYLKEEDSHWDMRVWENLGVGGTELKGDGISFCDMTGRKKDNSVWIHTDGKELEISVNVNPATELGNDVTTTLPISSPRAAIHLADWDGDGRCDVVVQDKATGALTLWHNDYDSGSGKLAFSDQGTVSGEATCTQGWGVGVFDRGMRLVDINGDKRADMLCLEPTGRITAWLNKKDALEDAGLIKFPEGYDRANMRFADVENTGRADLLVLDKWTGATTMFKNDGYWLRDLNANGGSSFHWTKHNVVYEAVDRGENIHFANLGGLGRADMVNVMPNTNNANAYFSECSDEVGNGGDDQPAADPGLPPYSSGSHRVRGSDGGLTLAAILSMLIIAWTLKKPPALNFLTEDVPKGEVYEERWTAGSAYERSRLF